MLSKRKRKNNCDKTLNGKHFWNSYVKEWEIIPEGYRPKTFYRKCIACDIIDSKIREYKYKKG